MNKTIEPKPVNAAWVSEFMGVSGRVFGPVIRKTGLAPTSPKRRAYSFGGMLGACLFMGQVSHDFFYPWVAQGCNPTEKYHGGEI